MENNAIHPQSVDVTPPGTQGRASLNHSVSASIPHLPQSSQSVPPIVANDASPASETAQHSNQKQPSRLSQWKTKWITDWWGVELMCWFIAVLSLIGIVVALESQEQTPPRMEIRHHSQLPDFDTSDNWSNG